MQTAGYGAALKLFPMIAALFVLPQPSNCSHGREAPLIKTCL
jgi:hypothetical protein